MLATMRGHWSRRWSPKSIEVGGKRYVVRRPRSDNMSGPLWLALSNIFGPPVEVYDSSSGLEVLSPVGRHWNWMERATIELLPDRGSLRLPIRGTRPSDAVMSVVDESGNVLCKIRFAAVNWWRWFTEVEVLLSNPGAISADIAIVIAVAPINLKTYFGTPSGSV